MPLTHAQVALACYHERVVPLEESDSVLELILQEGIESLIKGDKECIRVLFLSSCSSFNGYFPIQGIALLSSPEDVLRAYEMFEANSYVVTPLEASEGHSEFSFALSAEKLYWQPGTVPVRRKHDEAQP